MKRTMTAVALATLAGCSAAAQAQTVNLYLVRAQDVQALSVNNDTGVAGGNGTDNSPFWAGSSFNGVAYAKNSVFIAGYRNSNDFPLNQSSGGLPIDPWPVSIVKIANILTDNGTTVVRGFTAIPASRITTNLFRGYSGLDYRGDITGGQLAATADNGGGAVLLNSVAVYGNADSNGPSLFAGVNNGTTDPDTAFRGNAGPSFDFGFNGSRGTFPAISVINFGQASPFGLDPANLSDSIINTSSQIYTAINPTTGTGITGLFNLNDIADNDLGQTEYRDLSIDPRNGNIAAFADGGVRLGVRTGLSTLTVPSFSPLRNPLVAGGANLPSGQIGRHVNLMAGFGATPADDLVVWNRRLGGATVTVGGATGIVNFNRWGDGVRVIPSYLNPDGTPYAFPFENPTSPAVNSSNGVYDFHWDSSTRVLALMDAGNRVVYFFSDQQPGPCCIPVTVNNVTTTECRVLNQASCTSAAIGGVWRNLPGGVCDANSCLATFPCCFTSGTCLLLEATACTSQGGTGLASGTCLPTNPCPQPPATGLCCAGSICRQGITQAACVAFQTTAVWTANGAGTCPGTNTSPCCKANYNHTGARDVNDLFAFLADWFARRPASDILGNGTGAGGNVNNIFAFLSAWFAAGCT